MNKKVLENSYMLCLDKTYDVELYKNDSLTISVLEGIIDNLVNLLQSYGVEDEEILDEFRDQTDVFESEE